MTRKRVSVLPPYHLTIDNNLLSKARDPGFKFRLVTQRLLSRQLCLLAKKA